MEESYMNNIPVMHLAATVGGYEKVEIEPYTKYPEHVQKRISELGLSALLEMHSINGLEQLEVLEKGFWTQASQVHKRRTGYHNKDFINALKLLEVFCLYAGQSNFSTFRKKVVVGEEKSGKTEVGDKTVLKAVKQLEAINHLLESDMKKRGKVALRKHVKTLIPLIDKILTQNLRQTEQIAMGKIVDKAERILEKI